MGTKRRPLRRAVQLEITDEIIEAYTAGDYHLTHQLLRLRPWELSPLPAEVTALGVGEDPPDWVREDPRELELWNRSLELQRMIKSAIAEKEGKR